ncbi:hypothetical protein D1007_42671 [Hordeum vulgare]|nr:hypothetical protein D1007_42671 [Hordeum vulgare]
MAQRPVVELHTPEARAEMLRVVRGLFPNRGEWPKRMVEVIRMATIEERDRFCGDDDGMDYELLFWEIQEAEAADLTQAARWRRFKTASPSWLNIRPSQVLELSRRPVESPGNRPSRLP